jgi:hypothetical protein
MQEESRAAEHPSRGGKQQSSTTRRGCRGGSFREHDSVGAQRVGSTQRVREGPPGGEQQLRVAYHTRESEVFSGVAVWKGRTLGVAETRIAG